MDENISKFSNIKIVLKGVIFSILLTLIFLLFLSLIVSNFDVPECMVTPCIIAISAISILIGSLICTVKIKEKGIVYGSCVGSIYFSLIYMCSSIINHNFSLAIESFIMLTLISFAGGLGGIIGVNIKGK